MKNIEWRKLLAGLIVILVAASALAGVVLFWRIVLAPVEIGEVSTESQAVGRANERVVQMFQWMISTILLMGGGLIGLNWYQSNQRYERDKEDLHRIEGRAQQVLTSVEQAPIEFEKNIATAVDDYLAKNAFSQDGHEDDQETDSQAAASNTDRKSTFQTIIENIGSRQSLPPFQRYVERYLSPNPFTNVEGEKSMAQQRVLEMLRSSKESGLEMQELQSQGIAHVWRLLPELKASDMTTGLAIEQLMNELQVPPYWESNEPKGDRQQ